MKFWLDLDGSGEQCEVQGAVLPSREDVKEDTLEQTDFFGNEYETFLTDRVKTKRLTLEITSASLGQDTTTGRRLWRALRAHFRTRERFIIFVEDRDDRTQDEAYYVRMLDSESCALFQPGGQLQMGASYQFELKVFQEGVVDGGLIYEATITDAVPKTIVGVDTGAKEFTVGGLVGIQFASGQLIEVFGSTGNDGLYTVTGVVEGGGNTTITVVDVVPSAVADGQLVVRTSTRKVYAANADFVTANIQAGQRVVNRHPLKGNADADVVTVDDLTRLTTTLLSDSEKYEVGDRLLIMGGNFDWSLDGYPLTVTDPPTINDGVAWYPRRVV